jgi:hypothetical protein
VQEHAVWKDIQETFLMRPSGRIGGLLASSFALVLWGCTGDQVENSAEATAKGFENVGKTVESAGKSVGTKIEHAGEGTKLEGAAEATGKAIERSKRLPPQSARRLTTPAKRSRRA